MRTIAPIEFVRRFRHGVTRHEARFVWFLGAGCSVSSGIGDAGAIARRWLGELKYLETGDSDGLDAWARGRFPTYDPEDPAAVYAAALDALFYTAQDQQREIERLVSEAEPGYGYATLAQLFAQPEWGERCNTVLTTNFDDLAADALYLYSQRKPQVLTHESLDRRVQISASRPTIVKLYGDAHLGPEHLDGNRRLLRRDVKERIRAQLTETGLIFVGYAGRDESILDLLDGLPDGAPAGGIYWINAAPPQQPLRDWMEALGAVWAPQDDFDALMYMMAREFDLGRPRTDRFDRILRKYDAQYRTLAQDDDAADAEPPADPEPTADPQPPAAEARAAADPDDAARAPDAGPAPAPDSDATPANAPAPAADWREQNRAAPAQNAAETRRKTRPSWGYGSRSRIDSLIAAAVEAMAAEDGAPNRPERDEPHLRLATPAPDAAPENPHARDSDDDENAKDAPGPAAPPLQTTRDANVIELPETARRALAPPTRLMPRKEAADLDRRFRAAIAERPRDARILAHYAQFLTVGRRDHDGAEHYFNRALDANPSDSEALRLFARFLAGVRRDFDRAEDCYRLAVRMNFEHAETMTDYAEFLWRSRGDFETARECFQVAVDAAPRCPRVLIRFAAFLQRAERNDDAAYAMLKLAAATAPDDAEAQATLGAFIAERRGDIEQAGRVFDHALALRPRRAATLAAAARFEADRRGDLAAAEELYREAAELDPLDAGVLCDYAQFTLRRRDDPDGAEALYERALEADPGSASAASLFAEFQEQVRADFEAADDLYRRAVHLDPRDAEALARYARFLAETRGNPGAAEERFRKAVALEPRNPLALRYFGCFLIHVRDDPDGAERHLRRAVEAAPTDAAALADLGQFLREYRGARHEAEEMFRRAIEADPRRVATLKRYARFMTADRRDPDAVEALYKRALADDPDDAAALAGAAYARLARGEREEGVVLLDRAFDSALAEAPSRRNPDLLLELWFCRYAFDRRTGRDAIKAAIWLVRAGARIESLDLGAIVDSAVEAGHPEPDLLRELAAVAAGQSPIERLERFDVA